MKLRSHLLVLTVATLIPMVAFAVIASVLFAQRERATFEAGATQRTLALLTAIDAELKSAITTVAAMAMSRHLDRGDLRAFGEDAARVLEVEPDWFAIDLALPSGQMVFSSLHPPAARLPMTAERLSFEQVLRTGQPAVGHLVLGPLTGQHEFAIRVPVVRQRVTKYILSAVITPQKIGRLLAVQRLPPDWVGVVLDGNSRIVARTVEPERTLGELASESLRAALARGSEGWFHGSTLEGAVVYTPYNRSAFSGWTMAMGIPAAAVEGTARRTIWLMAAGLVGAAALAFLFALVLGRRISRPFGALASAAQALGRGERPASLDGTRVEEVATLGRAFADASRLLRLRAARLAHLQAISDVGLSHIELEALLPELLPRLRAALEADTASILLVADDGTHLTPVASDGLDEEIAAQARIPIGEGAAGRIARSQKGLVFDELGHVDVVSPYLRDRVKSLVGVPLRIGDRLVGVIHVGAAAAHRFTADDLELLRLAGERVARAIERAQLAERQREARAEAEAASRSKDEFLAVLSHELRTPLNAVYGWARMMQSGQAEGEVAARALDVIMRNAHAQVRLIDDLLDVSRIITGKMRLDVRPVDLQAVVEAALDSVRPAAAAKDIRLEPALDPRAVGVMGDPNRLQQVVWNLLVNAVKFTPTGGRVQVHLARMPAHVEIIVSDTGQGIRPEVLPHVFERFRQADSTTTRAHAGLGIGLALVRHLVELHGGRVRAESPGEGQGARFIVTLPLGTAREFMGEGATPGRASALVRSGPAASVPGPSLRGVRVLAVDDDRDSLELITAIVAGADGEIRTCASAAEGFRVFREWRPDILLSDIEMPDEDGYTFIRKVRGLDVSEAGKTPAVALTAYGRAEDRLRTLSAGYNMHLPKPVDPAELTTIIASLAGR
jgi:signal transduction histidine kinase